MLCCYCYCCYCAFRPQTFHSVRKSRNGYLAWSLGKLTVQTFFCFTSVPSASCVVHSIAMGFLYRQQITVSCKTYTLAQPILLAYDSKTQKTLARLKLRPSTCKTDLQIAQLCEIYFFPYFIHHLPQNRRMLEVSPVLC